MAAYDSQSLTVAASGVEIESRVTYAASVRGQMSYAASAAALVTYAASVRGAREVRRQRPR